MIQSKPEAPICSNTKSLKPNYLIRMEVNFEKKTRLLIALNTMTTLCCHVIAFVAMTLAKAGFGCWSDRSGISQQPFDGCTVITVQNELW